MREYAKKPESQSRTLDSNTKASRQAPIDVILQRYSEETRKKLPKISEHTELKSKEDILQKKPNQPIQRYASIDDMNLNISENEVFAIPTNEEYPLSIYIKDDQNPPLNFKNKIQWEQLDSREINNSQYTKFKANCDQEATNLQCGEFAIYLTNDISGDDRSVGEAGSVLKDSGTSGDKDFGFQSGWENHFAAIIMKDGNDHATFETAVGIPNFWIGIYGTEKGKTFRYKTQVANINRMKGLPDAILRGEGEYVKKWYHNFFCMKGQRTDLVIPQKISDEDAENYQNQLREWCNLDVVPEDEPMLTIINRLIEEQNLINQD